MTREREMAEDGDRRYEKKEWREVAHNGSAIEREKSMGRRKKKEIRGEEEEEEEEQSIARRFTAWGN